MDGELTREEYLYELGELHMRWAKKLKGKLNPDLSYAKNNTKSQYPETEEDMAASVEDEDEYWDEVEKLKQRRKGYGPAPKDTLEES